MGTNKVIIRRKSWLVSQKSRWRKGIANQIILYILQSRTNCCGTWVGLCSMLGKRAWNSVTWRRESISAAELLAPGTCLATKWILCWSERSIKHLIKIIKLESLEVVLLMICTTVMLSQWSTTVELWICWHQSSNEITIGRNSRTAIWNCNQLPENWPKNHFLPKIQPNPRSLASVNKCKDEEEWVIPVGKMAFPLKWSKNICHAFKSALASELSLRWWKGFLRPIVKLIRRRRKCDLVVPPDRQNLAYQ